MGVDVLRGIYLWGNTSINDDVRFYSPLIASCVRVHADDVDARAPLPPRNEGYHLTHGVRISNPRRLLPTTPHATIAASVPTTAPYQISTMFLSASRC